MGTIQITGGCRLTGEVNINGAKNAILPLLASSLLFENEQLIFENIPRIRDVRVMLEVLAAMGVQTKVQDERVSLHVPATADITSETDEALVSQMRATILIMAPMLAKKGKVKIALPGGCSIGYRPIALHTRFLEMMGASIVLDHGMLIAEAPDGLHPVHASLDIPSVGVTESLIMAATLTRGTTVIENAAKEPEVVDLARFLNLCGANISGAGTDMIEITGVDRLIPVPYEVIPDRIEAATYMLAVASSGGTLTIRNVIPTHLETLITKLRDIGITLDVGTDEIKITANPPYEPTSIVDVRSAAYPGFATDMQPLILALLLQLPTSTFIVDTIFPSRFQHIEELSKVGVNVTQLPDAMMLNPERALSSGKVKASDLRSAAAMVLVGISQPIVLEIENIDVLDRGYEDLITKLNQIGAQIEYI